MPTKPFEESNMRNFRLQLADDGVAIWQKHPFVRIIIALLPGIPFGKVLYNRFPTNDHLTSILATSILLLGLFLYIPLRKKRNSLLPTEAAQTAWGVTLFMFLFLVGTWRTYDAMCRLNALRLTFGEGIGTAVITDVQSVRERSITFQATLTRGFNLPPNCTEKILITTPPNAGIEEMAPGDELLFRGKLQQPKNRGNPEEFDYAGYLKRKGIVAQIYVADDSIMQINAYDGHLQHLPLSARCRIKALRIRSTILRLCAEAGLHGDAFALFSALTTGDKSRLSKELKSLYTETGTRHLLALSGMHLGILTFLFMLIIRHLLRVRWLSVVGTILTILMIWAYVLFAGLPTSLCRAALMYTLMISGNLLGRSGFSINSLCCAAFVMLCANPLYLYDVGFQLSYLSMLGILVVCPKLQGKLPKWRPARWVAGSILVSLSAQLFTVPLTVYNFASFSPYSALSTLLVMPFTTLLIWLLPVVFLSAYWGEWMHLTVSAAALIADCQNKILRAIAAMPFTVIQADWSLWFVVLCYAALAVLLIVRFKNVVQEMVMVLVVTLVMVFAAAVNNRENVVRPQIIFYNCPGCPAAHVIYDPYSSYLFPVINFTEAPQKLSYIAETFWVKKLKAVPRVVPNDYTDKNLRQHHGLVGCNWGVIFLVLYDDYWTDKVSNTQLDVDYILICRGYNGKLEDVARLFCPRLVVLDASLYNQQREYFKRICAEKAWPYYDIKADGALCVPLK